MISCRPATAGPPADHHSNRCRFADAARRKKTSSIAAGCFANRHNHIVQPAIRMTDVDRDMFGIVMHVALGKPNPPTARHQFSYCGGSSSSVIAITPSDL